ncbi:MAG: aminotransferase class I/II-fold pyridoxal phosphate-dependent enzyme [Acidobacteriota bacterium]|nr:aminotransferase class I/II-fold pyridoxal phosphate-dependent enzyme [Acidobacteriota bacterium]
MSEFSGDNLKPTTVAIHGDGKIEKNSSVAPPIYQTSTFGAPTPEEFAEMTVAVRPERFYTRYGNPTAGRAAAVIAGLEKAEATLLTGSGMAAVTTSILGLVKHGDHIIAQQSHYGGTVALLQELLPRYGIDVTFVEQTIPANFENAITDATKLIIVESPSNPLMHLTDFSAIAEIAGKRGIITVADNTFASPVNSRPVESGIDLVVHSATKYLGGHSDILAGAISGCAELVNKIWRTSTILGGSLSPFESWLLLRGLRTLSLRVERQNQTALSLARFLETHPKVERIYYPGLESHPQYDLARRQLSGFTGILSFEISGGAKAADKFISALRLAAHSVSVGGIETLVVRPAAVFSNPSIRKQFARVGVYPNLVRISVGLEDDLDLIADVERALLSV